MFRVVAIGEDLQEFGVPTGAADILWGTAAGCVEEEGVVETGDGGFDLLDLDRMRPAIAKIIEVLER